MVVEQANKQSSNQGTQQQKRERIKKKKKCNKIVAPDLIFLFFLNKKI